jgi:hypothetical protein
VKGHRLAMDLDRLANGHARDVPDSGEFNA